MEIEEMHKKRLAIVGCACALTFLAWLTNPHVLEISNYFRVASMYGAIELRISPQEGNLGAFRQMYAYMFLKLGMFRAEFARGSQYTILIPYWLITIILMVI